MTFNELKAKAEAMGFKFETQTWIPDDYDEHGRGTTEKDRVSAIKVTYPVDYPHPVGWVNGGTDSEKVAELQFCVTEYESRFVTAVQTAKHNAELREAMKNFEKRFGK